MATQINLDTAQRVDITCRRGDTFDMSLTIQDAGGVTALADNDSFKMEVRVADTDDTAYGTTAGDSNDNIILSTLDPSSGATKRITFDLTGHATGVVTFTATAATMLTRPSGLYVYDIEMTDTSETKVTTLIYGTFKINEDVSV
jgi:hypothetical protein